MLKLVDGARPRARFLLRRLAPERQMTVCDVGARPQTTPPYKLLHEIGGCHVWGFEPDEDAFARLQALGHDNATYLKQAIGAPGPATFYRHPIGSIASTFPIAEASARFLGKFHWIGRDVTEIPLDLVGLDQVDGLPMIDVLKIDIQGGELDVFRSGQRVLSEAVAIIPEVRFYRMYEGEPLWRDVDRQLSDMGFVLHKFMHPKQVPLPSPQRKRFGKRKIASQLLDGDAVYIRSLDRMDAVSDAQLKYLAIAAETMFQSYDLVLMCLNELALRGVIDDGLSERYFDLLPDDLKDLE